MGLDKHLQASTLAGLVDSSMFEGAANYLKDKTNPSQVSRTLVCRVISKKEGIDMHPLLSHITADGPVKRQKTKQKATHVITGIVYGAEAYCVFTQDFDEADPNSREDAEENLAKISSKMENALENSKDVTNFKEQLTRKEIKLLANSLKCRLYADLQTQPVRECSVFDAYKYCFKLIKQVKNADVERNATVPLFFLLSSLISTSAEIKSLQLRDVNAGLVERCCRIWTEFEQLNAQADAIPTDSKFKRATLCQFHEIVERFQTLVKNKWKDGVIKARQNEDGEDDEVEKAITIAETHHLFKVSRLKRWLQFKKAEFEMAATIKGINGIIFLADKTQLEKKLTDSIGKFTLVLSIPSLDEKTSEILSAMKEYVENYSELTAVDDGDDLDEDGLPWHVDTIKRKLIMDKISEMSEHANKNTHMTQVQFFVAPEEKGRKFECHYSVYQADNLLKDNVSKLPIPPTRLRIQTVVLGGPKRPKLSTVPIKLTWHYEDLGYPCTFLVKYRPNDDGDGNWKQQKTSQPGETQMTITLRQDTSMEIRVAAETCIGCSEFTEVIAIVNESDLNDCIWNFAGNVNDLKIELNGNKFSIYICSLYFFLINNAIFRNEIGCWRITKTVGWYIIVINTNIQTISL